MHITINGQDKTFEKQEGLDKIIRSFSCDSTRIIAELNGQIIKYDQWNETQLKDGDVLELVTFVGGG